MEGGKEKLSYAKGRVEALSLSHKGLKIGGRWWDVSDKAASYLPTLKVGDEILFGVGEDEKVRYIKKLSEGNGKSASGKSNNSKSNGKKEEVKEKTDKDTYWDEKLKLDIQRNEELTRMAVLNSAIEVAKLMAGSGNGTMGIKEIIELAKAFETYVKTGNSPKLKGTSLEGWE